MVKTEFYRTMVYSLIYVSLGTIALFSLSLSSPLHGEWAIWVVFLTIPTSILSFTVMLVTKDPIILVLIIQFFMFLMAWRIIYSPTVIRIVPKMKSKESE
jgi:hypothetical protein